MHRCWPRDWLGGLGLGGWARPLLDAHGRWIGLAVLVGTVSGVGAIGFDLLFRLAQSCLLGALGGFVPPGSGIEAAAAVGPDNPWRLVLPLVLGAAGSALLVYALAPEAEGHGTDAVIHAFHHEQGRIRPRVPFVKAVASALTIGSGGSAGREGPIAQIGAGFGSYLGTRLRLRHRDRRVLMIAGAAGGIGSIFRAPLGASLFAAEVLYRKAEFEYEALLPGLIAAITGYCVYSSYAGWGLLFAVPPLSFHELHHLPFYMALGVLCAVAGSVYPRIFYGFRDRLFRPLPLPRWSKPILGAALLGLLAVQWPELLGMGYGYIQQAIDGGRAAGFLLAFAGLKIVATSLTVASGASGGVFGPSLVIGGALGGAFGQLAHQWFGGWAPPAAACIMVGMGGFFAGVAKVPFAAVIMVMEMTGSYGLLVPSLLVAAIAYLLTPPGSTLYESQVDARIDSPAHLGSFATEILRGATVGQSWNPADAELRTLRDDQTLAAALQQFSGTSQNVLPVVDARGRLVGELSLGDARRAVVSEGIDPQTEVRRLLQPPLGPLTPQDDLFAAARLLARRQADAVVLVHSRDDPRVLGLFTRRDLVLAYGARLEQLREDWGESAPS
ncbi:MAG: chloride channel protein [Planctomycetota bacterium]|nr:MAG: chloride channel protein [Planctomycetota bacterium]